MAQLTITAPDLAVPRIRAMVGRNMALGRDATNAECEQYILKELKEDVVAYERNRLAALPHADARTTVEAEFA